MSEQLIPLYKDKKRTLVPLSIKYSSPEVHLTLRLLEEGDIESSGLTYSSALESIRYKAELYGWIFGVNAARLDVIALPTDNGSYDVDRVLQVNETHSSPISALLEAPLNQVGTLDQQKRALPELARRLEEHETAKLKRQKKKVEVVQVKTERPRFGIFLAFLSLGYPPLAYILLVAAANTVPQLTSTPNPFSSVTALPSLSLGVITVGLLLWSYAVTQCVTEIARSISLSARIGLFILLSIPIFWTLTVFAYFSIYGVPALTS